MKDTTMTMHTVKAHVKSGNADNHPIHNAEIVHVFCFDGKDTTYATPQEQAEAIAAAWEWDEVISVEVIDGGVFELKEGAEFVKQQFPYDKPLPHIGEWKLDRKFLYEWINQHDPMEGSENWSDEEYITHVAEFFEMFFELDGPGGLDMWPNG